MSFNKAKALKTASKYVQQGKYQSAIEEYRQIAQADPSDVTTLNTLGDLYVKVGQTNEAITSFVHIAEHYRVSGFYLKAIAMLKKVSKLDTKNIEVSLKLAGLYAQQKLIVDARHQYLAVAEHYIREGQSQQALEIYQRIADLDPENTAVQIKLAEAFLRENQFDKAYDTFVMAAGEMRRQNKDGEALQTYLRAIKAQPRGQAALASAVNLYLEREESQQAIELIEGLLAERPNDAELLTLLARIYQSTSKLEAAEEAIEKMLDTARTRYQYALDLSQAYVQKQDVTGALRVFDRVAEILYEYREEEKAAQLLRDILALESQHLGSLTRLAAVYERTHDDHLLIETLNWLADAAIQADSEPAAVSALKRLLELEPDEIQHRRRLRQLIGDEADLISEPSTSANYQHQSSSRSEEDFWDSGEAEQTEFGESQPESSSYSAMENGVVTNSEDHSESWGSWSTTDTSSQETSFADESQYSASFDGATSESAFSSQSSETFENSDAAPTVASFRDELESVDFYLHQGMLDVARYTLEPIANRFPDAPEVQAKLSQLREAEAQAAQTVLTSEEQFNAAETIAIDPPSFAPVTPVAVDTEVEFSVSEVAEETQPSASFSFPDIETGYLASPNTGFESVEELAIPVQPHTVPQDGQAGYSLSGFAEEPKAPTKTPAPAEPSFDLFEGDEMGGLLDFLDEFKAETEQHNPQEDFETHYNLGLAYKEMDMFEEAIEEFQQAFKAIMNDSANSNYVSCCNMLAFCFSQKGLPRLAVVWLKKAMEAPIRDENVIQALRYDLADAYAAMGEFKDAYNMFAEIYAVDVQYRGVKGRMQEIAAQMGS